MTKEDHLKHKEMSSTNAGLYSMDRIYGLLTAVAGLQIYHGYNYDFTAYWKMAWVRLIHTKARRHKIDNAWQCIKFSIPVKIYFNHKDSIRSWREKAEEEMK